MRSASNLSVEEKIKVCAELYQRGMSTRDIQVATGIGKSSIPSYLKAAGVQPDAAARISAKMIGKPGHRKGSTHTVEAKLLISQKAIGNKRCLGRKVSQESIEKNRASNIAAHPKKPKLEKGAFVGPRKPRGVWLHPDEKAIRKHLRAASKTMLRRILTMARVRKDAKTETLLGYSKEQLRHRLESQFKTGMSWANRASFHIDHIVPVADFFRRGVYDPAVINALSNLQPLTPEENREKRDRVITVTDAGAFPGIVRLT